MRGLYAKALLDRARLAVAATRALTRHARIGLLAATIAWTSSSTATPPAVSEYALKAAVLLKVAKFVEWPAGTFANDRSTVVMCVVGRESALPAFESLERSHMGSHPIDVRLVTGDMLDLRQCQIAFFPNNSGADVDYALSKLEGSPVLTVGETQAFAADGGVLALVTLEQRVSFTINLKASKRSGLTISSQLLQLATVIEDNQR